jgi:hypothetical protein
METRSFVIIASNQSSVEIQIEKLNRRARKLGLDEITYSWGKARIEERDVLHQDINYPDLPPSYVKRELLVIPVEITGPLNVSYEGWEFIATLQHLPTGDNIIRSISDVVIPKQYHTAGCNCQHCNVKRYRKDTYLLSHNETKAIVQVGSTCIKDFLGGNSPDNIMSKANFIAELISFMDSSSSKEESYSRGECQYHIERFLAITSACIRDHGWLSKTKANEDGGIPTATWVQNNVSPPMGFKTSDLSEVTSKDKEVAQLTAEWAENLSDDECDKSDYLHNIRAIARSGMVGYRTFGFAASMISSYRKSISDKEIKKISNYVGEVKKRQVFQLVLKRHFTYSSTYGVTHKYLFEDKDGNVFIWSTSSNGNLEEEILYPIKGTVKEHSVYDGTKQTHITRCEVLNS